MSYFQRIKNIISGGVMLLLAAILALLPEWGILIVALVLQVSLFVYGFRLLFYYFTMARHMVSGKKSLYRAIILLDIALFTGSLITTGRVVTVMYLLAVLIFSGFISILRAVEAKHVGTPLWRFKLIGGMIKVLLAVGLGVAGFAFRSTLIPVYGYCVFLAYTAAERIITAFRQTEIVYIQ